MKPYGCHNSVRKTHFWVKDGVIPDDPYNVGFGDGIQYMKRIKDVSTKSCQYRLEKPNDERCKGCTK